MGVFMGWLNRPRTVRTLQEARALLDKVTPLKADCGRVCGGACCAPDETGDNGMLLFPYEEAFYQKPIEGFPFRLADDDTLVKGGKRLICEGSCPREHRPLACRIFPLRIRLKVEEQGAVTHAAAELDPRAWAVCPLCEDGKRGLRQDFVQAVEQAGELMLQNVYLLEALSNEQKQIDEMRNAFR